MTTPIPTTDIHTAVREHYGQIAEKFVPKQQASCCGPSGASVSCCGNGTTAADVELAIYETEDIHELPEEVTGLSLGCGDPITLAQLQPGQTVLDLGSGGGIDCFLAAKKVGPGGQVIGVDMTPAMLEKARANKAKVNATNVDFRLGEIEHLPVADSSVDVIISNCVINLSPDKPQVFGEAFRVLKSGGKLAVSDIVTDGPLPEAVKASLSAWAGCVAGAWEAAAYLAALRDAGFADVSLTPQYFSDEMVTEAKSQLELEGIDLKNMPGENLQKTVFSARITARKP
ncbi:MAG: arsenite methyltransferase [Chloroflexota bacterium]